MTNPVENSQNAASPAEERLNEITSVAAEMFLEKGYAATSIQDIAERVGMLKGSLYYYIRGKEDLLYEVVRAQHEKLGTILEDAQSIDGTPLAQFQYVIRRHVELSLSDRASSATFVSEFRSLSQDRRREIVQFRDEFESYLQSLIDQARDLGLVATELDASVLAKAILGMVNMTHMWYRPGGRMSQEEIAEAFSEYAVNGLRPVGPIT